MLGEDGEAEGRVEISAEELNQSSTHQVGLYFLSNSFLMKAAMSFSMLNWSSACLGGGGARVRGGGIGGSVGRSVGRSVDSFGGSM